MSEEHERTIDEWISIIFGKRTAKRRAKRIALSDILYSYTEYLDSKYQVFYEGRTGTTDDIAHAVSEYMQSREVTINTLLNMD